MVKDPMIGYKVVATVTVLKENVMLTTEGESFEISIHNAGGLCGSFSHNIFPSLHTFQFGGSMPWWQGDTIQLQCPDNHNLVTIKLERSKR